jgi:hypothetical protein
VYYPKNKFSGPDGKAKLEEQVKRCSTVGGKLVREVGPFFGDLTRDKHTINSTQLSPAESKLLGEVPLELDRLQHGSTQKLRDHGRASIGVCLLLSDVTTHDEWASVDIRKLLRPDDTWSAEEVAEKFKGRPRKPAVFDGF